MSVFEAGMLICFGFAWPISVIKSYRSRSNGGKSPWFSGVVILGYILGITHKMVYSRDIVMVLYVINLMMITADLLIWFRNRRLERQAQAAEKE
ncbi:MAG: hypothetical protein E7442_03070 [Ruminococcaceae bacterium]|nr:hypothetical protein [Oscillospiraceae bacterium]